MNVGKTRGTVIVRAIGELIIVIVGVVLGLAVDRWVAGIDDRSTVEAWSRQLSEAITQDSAAMTARMQTYQANTTRGLELLNTIEGKPQEILDPTEFVRTTEMVGWWVPFNAERSTWDEITATGQLSLFEDADLRKALTAYYAYLDRLANLEEQWVMVFQDYWERQQAVVPPLLRIEILDDEFGLGTSRPVTQAEARIIAAGFQQDDALKGALGTAVGVYRYGIPFLAEYFPIAAAAKAALGAN